MTLPDIINGALESCGGFFIWLSVIKLGREKVVRGVSWMHVAFFSSWGFWNLFYYPHLGQWMSFYGGVFLVAINAIWLGQIVYYNYINALADPGPRMKVTERRRPRLELDDGLRSGYPAGIDPLNLHDFVQKPRLMVNDQFGGFDRTERYRHSDK